MKPYQYIISNKSSYHFKQRNNVEKVDNGGVRGYGKWRVRRICDNSSPETTGARSIEPERIDDAVGRNRVRSKRGGETRYSQGNQWKYDETVEIACNHQGGEMRIGGHQTIRDPRAPSGKRKDEGMEGKCHAGNKTRVTRHQAGAWRSNNRGSKTEFPTY